MTPVQPSQLLAEPTWQRHCIVGNLFRISVFVLSSPAPFLLDATKPPNAIGRAQCSQRPDQFLEQGARPFPPSALEKLAYAAVLWVEAVVRQSETGACIALGVERPRHQRVGRATPPSVGQAARGLDRRDLTVDNAIEARRGLGSKGVEAPVVS